MKKVILVLVVIGMSGWAVYDFLVSTDDTAVENTSSGGGKITSPPPVDKGEVGESDEVGLSVGQIAPDFTLRTLEGKEVNLSDYRG